MLKIGIVVGSTRPNRVGASVAQWVHENAAKRGDAEYELVDLADYNLPLLDEPFPPSFGQPFANKHTKAWAEKVDSLDAFVFVTPEYNHSTSGALKNAFDYLYYQWHNKAAGFVSYGSTSGVRAVEHLRQIVAELHLADVRAQVSFSLFEDFEEFTRFAPRDLHADSLTAMLDQLVGWGEAMKGYRGKLAKQQE